MLHPINKPKVPAQLTDSIPMGPGPPNGFSGLYCSHKCHKILLVLQPGASKQAEP